MTRLQEYFGPLIKRQRNKNLAAAVFLLLLAVAGAVWGLVEGTADYAMARMVAGSMIGAVAAVVVFVLSVLPHRGLAALAEPGQIVWVYGLNRSGHVHAVMVGFEDGKLFRFRLPLISIREGFSQEAFPLLRAAAPQATHGYTEESRSAFRREPSSLRRSPPSGVPSAVVRS